MPQSKNFQLPQTRGPKVISFQKTFSNINGKKESSLKKVISDGKKGKMYEDKNGQISITNLSQKEVRKQLLPGINLRLNNFLLDKNKSLTLLDSNYPLINNPPKASRDNFKIDINTIFLFIIFCLLVYISVRLSLRF